MEEDLELTLKLRAEFAAYSRPCSVCGAATLDEIDGEPVCPRSLSPCAVILSDEPISGDEGNG
jgi:hypothetical protein